MTSQQNARGFYSRAWPAADPPTSGSAPRARARSRRRARRRACGPRGREKAGEELTSSRPAEPAAAPGTSRRAGRCRPGSSWGPAHPFPRPGLPGRCASRPRACCALGFRQRSRGGEPGGREARFSPATLALPGSAETQASSARAPGVPASGPRAQGVPGSGARARAVGPSQWRAGEAEAQARPRPLARGQGAGGGGASGRISWFAWRRRTSERTARGQVARPLSRSQRRAPRGDGGAASETHGGRGRGCVLAEAWEPAGWLLPRV